MSKRETIQYECPQCGKASDFVIWNSVNTELDPETKQAVRDCSLFTFHCPECGSVTRVLYPFLYHQMEDKLMIHFVDDEERAKNIINYIKNEESGMLNELSENGYIVRVVMSIHALLEKLAIFDAGLDDRIVELSKMVFAVTMDDDAPEIKTARFIHTTEGENVILFFDNNNSSFAHAKLTDELYESLKEKYVDKLPEYGLGELCVDARFAYQFFTEQRAGEESSLSFS